ncbi:hypothetical protein [Streptomyces sp. Ncost-T10-10d]|uniref:hypothetical protein n=1 Tax=Streptomyces sp. Ncost-T10-10d TaxID=1839774 RepID=UPI00081D6586|nr:hypothetical protein [Streptomyces sp. Ncost-T10-10d]SCF72214.1 hypothetical protein GA0115254_113017 [Streptomyces sp. Ncost-T10-10d]
MKRAATENPLVVGFTGPRRRPHHLALVVGDEGGSVRLSARLDLVLAARIGAALGDGTVLGERRAHGETYTRVESDLVVEVLAGPGRRQTLTVVRMR